MKSVIGIVGILIAIISTDSFAGHCRKGSQAERTRCLNNEVAYLTTLNKRRAGEIRKLEQELQVVASQIIPLGAVVAWNSSASDPPKGWEFCDGLGGKPNLDERWLVGTKSPDKVGQMTPTETITLSARTEESVGDNKYSWGDTENNTPHATGLDHKHDVSISIDPTAIKPPSVYVRFICKVR